jgi:hypothetical protein
MAENKTLPQLTTVSSLASSDLLYLVRTSTLDRAIAWSDVITTLGASFQPLDSALTSFSSLVSNVYSGSATWNPGSIGAGLTVGTSINIAGVAVGDIAIVSRPTGMTGGIVIQGIAESGSVSLFATNTTGSPISEPSFSVKVLVFRLA